MSIICSSNKGWLISHQQYFSSVYNDCEDTKFELNKSLFEIHVPYMKLKNTKKQHSFEQEHLKNLDELSAEVEYVKTTSKLMINNEFKSHFSPKINAYNNETAMNLSKLIYEETEKFNVANTSGFNNGKSTIKSINGGKFLFPENSTFFCNNISELHSKIKDKTFDLILLDPPWWNKYIRRKRKKSTHAYEMMYNNSLEEIQINNLLKENGLVAVWCTNSQQNIHDLTLEVFPKWNIEYIAKWYWLKVTKSGEPVCNFSRPPGKQPFEQIIFGRKHRNVINPPDKQIVISVPSALHSHKPPLAELLKIYLPHNPVCLELFSRYLLPNWTSYGNETLKFQLVSAYVQTN